MTGTLPYFPFYLQWVDFFKNLSDADYGRLIKAIGAYAMGENPDNLELSPEAMMAYNFIASTLERHKTKTAPDTVAKRETPAAPEKKEAPREQSNAQKADAPKKPPTKDEVRNYFLERHFSSSPDEFFNFYESNGWRVGQNPMYNWRASAENFECKNRREQGFTESHRSYTPQEKPRYGDFDATEAFWRNVNRTLEDSRAILAEEMRQKEASESSPSDAKT